MADNVELDPGTGGATIATDDVGGVQYQVVKLAVGADGAASLVANANPIPISDAGGSLTVDAASLPLPTGASTAAKQPALGTAGTASTDVLSVQGIAAMTPLQVGDNSASLTVDAPVGTPVFVRLSDGSAAISTLPVSLATVPSHAVTNAGTFATQVDGAALTALQLIDNLVLAEDAAHGSGDPGLMPLAVRRDADTSLVGTDGDYAPLQVNASGSLKVAITAGAGSGGTSIADGATFTRDTTSVTLAAAAVESSAPTLTNGDAAALSMTTGGALRVAVASGGIAGIAEDSAAAGGEEGIMMLAVRRDAASSGVSADGDFAALSVDSNGALRVVGSSGTTQYAEDVAHASGDQLCIAGAVRRDTAAVGSGTDGDYSTLNVNASGRLYTSATVDAALPAGTNNIGDVDVLTLPNVTLAAGTNTNEVVGDAAHGAAVAGNPLLAGLEGRSTAPTAVDDGDVVRALATLLGKQVMLPYALPANTWDYASPAAVTDTADDEAKAATASTRHYVTSLQVFNADDTVGTEVVLKDGSTVRWRGWAEQTGGGCSAKFDPPLRGTANTAWNVANITTSAETYFNLQGFSATE